jgi:hypothetical protein
MQRRVDEMRERTVAIQLRMKSLFPKAVLMPAAVRLELNDPVTSENRIIEVMEAAKRKMVERMEVVAPPMMARGAHQARIEKAGVMNVKMKASTYATPRNPDAEP